MHKLIGLISRASIADAIPQRTSGRAECSAAGTTYPRKGTTPARGGGGEGRRVSAPGGRADTPSAKPSTAYYTHDSIARRKSCLKLRAWDFATLCLDLRSSRATETWLTGRFVGHLAVCRTVALCWGGDRLGVGR